MNEEAISKTLPGDNPIREPKQDVLKRAGIADTFARQILRLDASEGAAVGVFGPWGSGKTSFVNLARKMFEDQRVPVFEFNPWMFSGTEQLVSRFFAELSAEMEERGGLQTVAEKVRAYSGALVGPTAALAGLIGGGLAEKATEELVKAFGALAGPSGSIHQLRDKTADVLREHAKPIIVVLDDVDRLSGPEIREVFKLVRLTASFPNLVYIVACDRLRVEQALEEPGSPGRDYLEKIIQFSYNLPETPRSAIREQARAAIARIESPGPYDDGHYHDIFLRIVEPLLRTMRDIRRYEVAVRSTAVNLEGKIEISDVLGLEAVRLFLPDVFQRLHGAVDILTVSSDDKLIERESKEYGILTSGDLISREEPDNPDSPSGTWLDEWIKAAGPQHRVVRAMIDTLFPAAATEPGKTPEDPGGLTEELLQRRRVGYEDILRFYLERVTGNDLQAFEDARQAVKLMVDRGRLNEFFRSREPAERVAIIQHLAKFHDNFVSEHVEPGSIVILNLLPSCPPEDLNSLRSSIRSTVSGLLSKLPIGGPLEEAVTRIWAELASPESKYELIVPLVCKGPRYSLDLDREKLTDKFKAEMCNWIRDDYYSDRIEDPFLASFISFLVSFDKIPVEIPNSPEMTIRIFWSCSKSFFADSPSLYWEILLRTYGDETILRKRMDDLRQNIDGLGSFLDSRDISIHEANQLLDRADEGRKQRAG